LYQSTKDNIMAVAEAMSSIDVFAANQLGDDDPSLHQGIDLQAECGSPIVWPLPLVLMISQAHPGDRLSLRLRVPA
jgi:hypothetical protein